MRETTDWAEVVRTSLSKLGGDKIAVPGAKLRAEAERLAREELGTYLRSTGRTFSQFLTDEVPEVLQHKRRGTDMVVGFAGAAVPVPSPTTAGDEQEAPLRRDLYAALTQVSPRPYAYIPSRDEFTNDVSGDSDAVSLPSVTLDELVEERRAFLEGVVDAEQQERLTAAVERSPNPLADFRRAVSDLGLGRSWYAFKLRRLREKLDRWTKDNDLEARPSWFVRRAEPIDTPQEALGQLAKHMTDDEVRGLMVPFRAVEALYRATVKRQRP